MKKKPKIKTKHTVIFNIGGVWMLDVGLSAARVVACDAMLAAGLDPTDFRTRDKIILAISPRLDSMFNYLNEK